MQVLDADADKEERLRRRLGRRSVDKEKAVAVRARYHPVTGGRVR